MTGDERQKLRKVARFAANSALARSLERDAPLAVDWQLQTSNSFRRIGAYGDGDVLCGTKHPVDGQPDLLAAPGVLDYIVAAQPRAVIQLLDDVEAADDKLHRTRTFAEKLLATTKRFVVELAAVNEKDAAEAHAVVEQLEVALAEMS